ncbi:transcriptional regulator with XRE-family HTH domain [Variovorax boronicumulans]|nr:transcriptional regulator with XRE-family HTH domain [Variovorax boronicumulans]MDQ0005139.1 transcriptional regulator with XRE-family HTH domain [Variovorax boronicumulans]
MATLSVIRRWALREQMSIREIARRTGLSRNTVKKYLRAGEELPRYAKRTSSSKLDPYAEKLATWLAIEATKSRKQRRNLRQIHTASTYKGEHQALIHTVTPSGSQSGWGSIQWKSRVKERRNPTIWVHSHLSTLLTSPSRPGLLDDGTLHLRSTCGGSDADP